MRQLTITSFLLMTLLALNACQGTQAAAPPGGLDPKSHHAVLLDNGSVFFGLIDSNGPDYVVLKNVFYVQTRVKDPAKKDTQNVLVRRGKEWHAPEKMIINRHKIVLIEPVAGGSTVAQLIQQAEK